MPLTTSIDIFTEHERIPLNTYEGLFEQFFSSYEYLCWLKPETKWQLRVIGSPGSGKTTLATLIVRHLLQTAVEQDYGIIVCIFMKKPVFSDPNDFLKLFLQSILSQLSRNTDENSQRSQVDDVGGLIESFDANMNVDLIRDHIRQRIAQLGTTFLLVDDFDLCGMDVIRIIEDEFLILQEYGLKILVTSRIPHHHEHWDMHCDSNEVHRDVSVYRVCKVHPGYDDNDDRSKAVVVCQSCFDSGLRCPVCSPDEGDLFEPYSLVTYQLGALENFRAFLSHELEIMHGDLGLGSDAIDKPPLSVLGAELSKTGKPLLAERLRDERISNDVEYNTALAKARLEFFQEVRTVDEVERVGSRLPDTILAIFDAAIDRINDQPNSEKVLGLHAIVGVCIHLDFCSFEQLVAWLQSQGVLDTNSREDGKSSVDDCLLRVLRATCGLLTCEEREGPKINSYHGLFQVYVQDKYNETLAQLAIDIGEKR